MIDVLRINNRINKLDKLVTLYQLELQSLKDLRDVYSDPAYDDVSYSTTLKDIPTVPATAKVKESEETPTLDYANIKEYHWVNEFLDTHPALEDTVSRCFDGREIKLTKSAEEAKLYSTGVNTYVKFINYMVRLGYFSVTLAPTYYTIQPSIAKLRKWPYEFK